MWQLTGTSWGGVSGGGYALASFPSTVGIAGRTEHAYVGNRAGALNRVLSALREVVEEALDAKTNSTFKRYLPEPGATSGG